MDNSSMPKSLLIGTVALMFLFVIGNYYLKNTRPAMETLQTDSQPTIGDPKAPVKILVIEEPKCPNCKAYNTLTFPKIKKDYIDTGKVQYTTLIVSFSDASFPAAQALLCAFYQDKDNPNDTLFYDFLNKIYRRSDIESSNQVLDEILLETAREANPNINIDELRKCMERQVYYTQIMRNNENAKRLMGGVQATPVIFINGVRSSGISSEIVSQAIESALHQPLGESSRFDSARQSQIEALRSERGSPSPSGKGDEEDQFGKAAASQNGNFPLEVGINPESNKSK